MQKYLVVFENEAGQRLFQVQTGTISYLASSYTTEFRGGYGIPEDVAEKLEGIEVRMLRAELRRVLKGDFVSDRAARARLRYQLALYMGLGGFEDDAVYLGEVDPINPYVQDEKQAILRLLTPEIMGLIEPHVALL